MNDVTLGTLEAVGGALSHEARLRVLALLREGSLYVCQIRTVLGLAASTVSVHLAILRRGGLVSEQKHGRFIEYALTREEPLGSVVREILHLVKEDRRVVEDAQLLEAVRRMPLDGLCRASLDVSTAKAAERTCRRRSGGRVQANRTAPPPGTVSEAPVPRRVEGRVPASGRG